MTIAQPQLTPEFLLSLVVDSRATASSCTDERAPDAAALPLTPSDDDSLVVLRNKRVVIAEDEGITLLLLKTFLGSPGLSVVGTASTAETAYECVMVERPDIVLLDIKMPGSMNGIDAAREILSTYRPCIVILSAYSDYIIQAQDLGINGYLVKPIERNKLLFEIKAAYSRHGAVQPTH